ncbi:class I SAM-dependent methyltransferase [Saccharomonospora azurea]|uniref:class I SAM-dependent methyltransferase n=1 Tax=Saccharomonospora azurea TaxID=40988 RepID=UPI00332F1CA8
MSSLGQVLDRAFGHPRGPLGRLGGVVMARGNAATEHHVVAVAKPTAEESVLVVGPGPGVGLAAAAERARQVIGVDPSHEMLELCAQRCSEAVEAGTVVLRHATAARTGADDESVDVVLGVNNLHLWEDRAAAFAELHRVLRPGGRMVLSAHEKWLPVDRHQLAKELEAAGFTDVQTWVWQPSSLLAGRAAQLRAWRAG